MTTTRALRALLATLLLAVSFLAAAAPQYRVVLHVSDGDPAVWRQAFNNARNLQKAFSKGSIAITMVIQGNAIGAARADSPVADSLAESVAAGMDVVACESTMRERNLRRDDMHRKVGFTPLAAVEILKKQQEGWAYIKP